MIEISTQGEDRRPAGRQLDLAYKRFKFSFMSFLLISVLIVVALWPVVSRGTLLAWLACLGLMLLFSRQMHNVIRTLFSTAKQNKELAAALLESDQRYRELFINFDDSIFFIDVADDGGLTVDSINPAAERMFGMTCAEVRGKSKYELFSAELAARLVTYDHACVESGKPLHYEEMLEHPSGNSHFGVTLIPMRDECGRIYRIAAITRDITERKHAEALLKKREAEFRTMTENSPAPIYRYDRNCRRVYVNPAVLRISGRPASLLLGKTPTEAMLVPPADSVKVQQSIERVLRTGLPNDVTVSFVAADGNELWFQNRHVPELGPDGTVESVLSIGRNITESRRYEQALLEQVELEQRFSRYLDSAPGFFFTLIERVDGSVAMPFASAGITSVYGLHPEDVAVTVEPIIALDHPDDVPKKMQAMEKSGGDLSPCQVEFRVRHPEKGERWVEARSMPLRDEEGNTYWHGFMHDITERKRMEEALAARERDFRSLAENMPENIARFDIQGRYLYINPTHERTLGVSASDIIGKELPDTHEHVKAAIAQVVATGQADVLVRQAVLVDGEIQIHEVSLAPECDAEGRIVSVLGLGRDMTEIYRMQDVIAEREQEFRSLAESSPDFIIRYDRDGRTRYLNTALLSLLGLTSAAEVIGKRPSEWSDGRFDAIEQAVARVVESNAVTTIELCVPAGSGGPHFHHLLIAPERDAAGQIVGTIAFGRDITGLKRLEGALAAREREFRSLAESSPDVIVRFDRECRRIYANPAAALLAGKPAEAMLGATPSDRQVLSAEQAKKLIASVYRVFGSGEAEHIGLAVDFPDGVTHEYDSFVVPEFDTDGQVMAVLNISRDITERKQAEAALKEKFNRITELNQYLEENARHMEEQATEFEAQAVELEASQEQIKLTEAWYRGILHSAPDGMLVVNERGDIVLANAQLETMFGYEAGELVGHPIEILLPSALRDDHVGKRTGFVASGAIGRPMASAINGLRGCRKDGSEFPVDVSLSRLPDTDGRVGAICAAIRDITERRRMEEKLVAREQEFRSLVENAPDVVVRYDRECRHIYVNPAWERVNGMSSEAVIGKSPQELAVHVKPFAADYVKMLRKVLTTGQSGEMDLSWLNEAGEPVCFEQRAIPEFDSNGKTVSVLTVARDISERRRMEAALAVREQESRTLVENSPDTIARYDRDCRRIYVNPTLGAMVEGGVAALLGRRPSECPGGPNFDIYETKISEVYTTGENSEFELKWPDKYGREACSHVRLTAECDAVGNVESVLAVGRDITELNEHRKRVYQMAFYDSLTSLPNRALFNDRLRQMLTDASWHGQLAGVMLLDLDRFKAVNDTLGHPVGDELLRETAARLTCCVRGYDTVARLGGDEFAILLPEIRSGDDLGRIASKILESFDEPFMLEGKEVFVSSSIGIALYPDDGSDADDLIKYADSAMYFAKRSGRNNFRFYSKDLTDSANDRLTLEADLRRGCGRGELELHFQPKVRLVDGMLAGSEALLRWNHPQRGMVAPDKFVSIAEDSGMIVEIGEWVLRTACRVACDWNSPGKPLHKVAINLSARQFQSNDLAKTVRSVLQETGCYPEWIELEITESLLLDEDGDVLETLEEFRAMGLTIAIDDFGTGYSSLSYLARFPIDTLKIDRSFVSRLTEYGHHAELVKAIISIAKSLDQQVVAEGVESAEQAALLQSYGCQMAQGYLYSKPIPKLAFEALQPSF